MSEPEPFAGSPDKAPMSSDEAARESNASASGAGADGRPEPPPSRWPRVLQQVVTANDVTVTVLAIVLAMVVGGVLIVLSTPDLLDSYSYLFARPADAVSQSWTRVSDAYVNLFKGSVLDWEAVRGWADGTNDWHLVFFPFTETLSYATPLIFTGLCFAVAFRGGLINIGVQGQAIMGLVFAALAGFLVDLPVVVHLLVALVAGALGGLIWGFIPGILKARTGAHEVITTIMLNYVAILFLNWVIMQSLVHHPTRSDAISKDVLDTAKLPRLLGETLRVDAGVIVALLVTAAIAWMMRRSAFGFELRAVGANPDAARTAGMSVPRTVVAVMAVTGALAGLGGTSIVLGSQADAMTGAAAGTIGFDGILVALLGRARPWGVVLAALLFGALRAGGNRMQSYEGISLELVTVIQALIVLFVAAPALVKALFQLRADRSDSAVGTSMAKGW